MANRLVAVDDDFNLPPEVRDQLTANFEAEFQTLHDEAVEAADDAATAATAAGTAATAAATSAAAAEAAAEEATAPTEAAVQNVLDDLVSEGDLSYNPDLVSQIKASTEAIIVAHRGGGARIYPEYSREGFEAAFRAGFHLEADIQVLSTGELVMCHDSTTTRTLTGTTANVADLTRRQWDFRQILPVWRGGKFGSNLIWDDLLDMYGGRAVIFAEVKASAALTPLINSIKARGLSRSVVIQSFTYAHCTAAVAAGIPALYLTGSTSTVTPAQMVSDGVEFFGPSKAMTQSLMATYTAVGIQVLPYSVLSRGDWVSLGSYSNGAFCDDPWGATQYYGLSETDPFTSAVPFYGWEYWDSINGVPTGSDLRVNYQDSGGLAYFGKGLAGSMSMRQGWAAPQSRASGQTVRLRFNLKFGPGWESSSTTRWGGVFLGVTPNDQAFQDSSTGVTGQTGYHFLFRRNGEIAPFSVASGTAAAPLTTLDTGEFADPNMSKVIPIEILLNTPTITIRRLDQTTNNTLTVTQGTYMNNLKLHFTANTSNVTFSDVSYTTIPTDRLTD